MILGTFKEKVFKNNILYLEPGRLQMLEYRLG